MEKSINNPTFKNPNFEKLIRDTINKPTDEITSEDMAGIEALFGRDLELSDISDIKYCVNLLVFALNGCNITDISPLKGLKILNYVELCDNPISDITVLSELENVGGLNIIKGTKISDISSLRDVVKLKFLMLPKSVENLLPLSSLTNLETLSLEEIDNNDALESLSNLVNINIKELNIYDAPNVTDVSCLKKLKNLEKLSIHNSQVTDFSPVSHVKLLSTVAPKKIVAAINDSFPHIKNEVRTDLPFRKKLNGSPVFKDAKFEQFIRDTINKPTGEITSEDMAAVKKLNITKLNLSDISGIEYCVNMDELCIDDYPITDISMLSVLDNLRILKIVCPKVVDISPLSKLTNLTNLYLDTSFDVEDISPLSELTELTQLILIQSLVSDITSLRNLKKLKKLICGQQSLVDLSPLSGLSELEELWLTMTKVIDYSPVAHIKNLRVLN